MSKDLVINIIAGIVPLGAVAFAHWVVEQTPEPHRKWAIWILWIVAFIPMVFTLYRADKSSRLAEDRRIELESKIEHM